MESIKGHIHNLALKMHLKILENISFFYIILAGQRTQCKAKLHQDWRPSSRQLMIFSSRKRDLVFTSYFFSIFSQSLLYYAYYESYIILFHQTMLVKVIPVILPDSNRIFSGLLPDSPVFSVVSIFLQFSRSLRVLHHPIS